jgi:hypothetical protein
MVGRPQDQAAVAADRAQPGPDLLADIVGRAEGQGVLLVERAPEAQPVPEPDLQFGGIHAGRLDRVEDVEADLDQVRDDVPDHPVRVVGNLDGGVDRLDPSDQLGHPRFEVATPEGGGDQHARLHSDIVAGPDHVNAHGGEALRSPEVVPERDLQDRVRDVRLREQVHHQLLEAAQRPGGLPDRGDRHTDDVVLAAELPDHPCGICVELDAVGIRSAIRRDGRVFGEWPADHLRVMACAERGLVRLGAPGHAPLVRVVVGPLVVRVRPADRGEDQVLVEGDLELVRVAAAVRVVESRVGHGDEAACLEVRAEPIREFRREADLHGAVIGFLVGEGGDDAIAATHLVPPTSRPIMHAPPAFAALNRVRVGG